MKRSKWGLFACTLVAFLATSLAVADESTPPYQVTVEEAAFAVRETNQEEASPLQPVGDDIAPSSALAEPGRFIAVQSLRYGYYYDLMRNNMFSSLIPKITESINPELTVITKECGVINAFYSRNDKTIVVCYELLADSDNFIKSNYHNYSIATQSYMELGVFFSVFLHELGHAIIDIKHVPIIGGEEDVADRISIMMLLPYINKHPNEGKTMLIGYLSYNWSRRVGLFGKLLSGSNLYADVHALNEQRVYNVLCLAYGSNPALFADTAKQFNVPTTRLQGCPIEFVTASRSLSELLH
jgi:hypothetical protein